MEPQAADRTPSLTRDVFICHSSADAASAATVCAQLEAAGVSCWIAPRDPIAGLPYGRQLVDAIGACRIVLLVFSSRANASRAVLNEIELASNRNKIVLPVRIEDVLPSADLEFYIRSVHWFDAVSEPLDRALPQLVESIARTLRDEPPPLAHAPTQHSPETRVGPALRVLDALPNNLSPQLTSFVGRDVEVGEIERLLVEHRLVTLAGAGGSGKTRCAIYVGAEMLDRSNDGVWLVELAPISDPSLVANVVAGTLSLQTSPNKPALETVVTYLERKRLLLILDNCEHVMTEIPNVVARILRECPDVHVLATSREALNIAGERVYQMPPLPVPPADRELRAETAMQYDSVALFVARATAAEPRFALTNENASPVAEICRQLDGLPLAIELAAPRIKVLSPKQLAQRLDERFKLLTGGDRAGLAHHRTLEALIAWSYDLLPANEQRLFRWLSIFAGGFTLDRAVSVCTHEMRSDFEVLDPLTQLVDKSLVHAEPVDAGDLRYRMLESTRAFARERLSECGEADAVAGAHAHAYLQLAEEFEEAWIATGRSDNDAAAKRELDNWRTALRWSLGETHDVALGRRLAAALRFAWSRFAPAEGHAWIREALARDDGGQNEKDVQAKLHLADAHLAMLFNEYKTALSAGCAALALFDSDSDPRAVAEAKLYAGAAAGLLGSVPESEGLLQAALDAFRSLQLPHRIGSVLQYLAMCRVAEGDVGAARPLFEEARHAYRRARAEAAAAHMALNLAEVEYQSGDVPRALELVREALASDSARGDEDAMIYDLINISAYLIAMERPADAVKEAHRALDLAKERGVATGIAFAVQRLAAVGALYPGEGDDAVEAQRDAARLLGFVNARFDDLGYRRDYTERLEYERATATLEISIGKDALETMMSEGRSWSEERAIEEASILRKNDPSCPA